MSIEYKHGTADDAARALADTIGSHLRQGHRVLWLLSGGSGGDVCAKASTYLSGEDLSGLYATMSDERYVPQGDANENWAQLLDKGLSLPGAQTHRPIQDESVEDTTRAFADWIDAAYAETDIHVALFGMGGDGHISGVKPHTVGVTSQETAVWYQGEDFMRVTTTLPFLATLDEGILQVFGSDKAEAITALVERSRSIEDQPARVIESIPQMTLYTDQEIPS